MRERFIFHHASPFAAWLDLQEPDAVTGNVDSPIGWVGRHGRHILIVDDRGFITHERHITQSEACSAFITYDVEYSEWCADEDEETACAIHPDRNHSTGDLACEILSQEIYYGTE